MFQKIGNWLLQKKNQHKQKNKKQNKKTKTTKHLTPPNKQTTKNGHEQNNSSISFTTALTSVTPSSMKGYIAIILVERFS